MGDYDDPTLTGEDPTRRGRRLAIAAALVSLALGLTVGFLVGGGTSRESSIAEVEVAPEPGPAAAPVADPAGADDACVSVGTVGTEVLTEIDGAVEAIGELDPGTLREILDRLQPLQGELEAAVDGCTAAGSR